MVSRWEREGRAQKGKSTAMVCLLVRRLVRRWIWFWNWETLVEMNFISTRLCGKGLGPDGDTKEYGAFLEFHL